MIAIVVVGTSVWVFVDAQQIGARKGLVRGLANLSPGEWLVACLLLWIVAFPLYLATRGEIRAASSVGDTGSGRPRAGERACPYCAEMIKAQAVKCKHCGSAVEAIAEERRCADEQAGMEMRRRAEERRRVEVLLSPWARWSRKWGVWLTCALLAWEVHCLSKWVGVRVGSGVWEVSGAWYCGMSVVCLPVLLAAAAWWIWGTLAARRARGRAAEWRQRR